MLSEMRRVNYMLLRALVNFSAGAFTEEMLMK